MAKLKFNKEVVEFTNPVSKQDVILTPKDVPWTEIDGIDEEIKALQKKYNSEEINYNTFVTKQLELITDDFDPEKIKGVPFSHLMQILSEINRIRTGIRSDSQKKTL